MNNILDWIDENSDALLSFSEGTLFLMLFVTMINEKYRAGKAQERCSKSKTE